MITSTRTSITSLCTRKWRSCGCDGSSWRFVAWPKMSLAMKHSHKVLSYSVIYLGALIWFHQVSDFDDFINNPLTWFAMLLLSIRHSRRLYSASSASEEGTSRTAPHSNAEWLLSTLLIGLVTSLYTSVSTVDDLEKCSALFAICCLQLRLADGVYDHAIPGMLRDDKKGDMLRLYTVRH